MNIPTTIEVKSSQTGSGVIKELPKTIKETLGQIPFDQYSRQYIAWRAVERMRTKTPLKILDIGGLGGKTREFFPEDDVTVLDLEEVDEPWYVKGDALDLPFKEGEFDFTVSFDVLEHIPQDKRRRYVDETVRVADTATIIAAPFYSKMAAQTEVALNHYYRSLTGQPHPWLYEHIDYSLPKHEHLEQYLAKNHMKFNFAHSNDLDNWTWLQFAVLLTASSDVSSQYLEQLYYFYNTHLNTLGDHSDNSYRRVYIAAEKEPPKDLIKEFRNDHSWEDQLKLKEITYQHIAQMKDNARETLISPEVSWYKMMNTKLQNENTYLHHVVALRQNELAMINQSRGWRIIKLTRKLRSKLSQALKGKQEEA